MPESILNHKKVLIVDDEPDILEVIKEEIADCCPETEIDTAGDYVRAAILLKSKDYDLVILTLWVFEVLTSYPLPSPGNLKSSCSRRTPLILRPCRKVMI